MTWSRAEYCILKRCEATVDAPCAQISQQPRALVGQALACRLRLRTAQHRVLTPRLVSHVVCLLLQPERPEGGASPLICPDLCFHNDLSLENLRHVLEHLLSLHKVSAREVDAESARSAREQENSVSLDGGSNPNLGWIRHPSQFRNERRPPEDGAPWQSVYLKATC